MTWKSLHTFRATQWSYCASLMTIGQAVLKLDPRLSFQVKISEIWPQVTFDLDHDLKIAPHHLGYQMALLCKFDENQARGFEIRAKVKFSG